MEVGQKISIPVQVETHIPSFKNCKRIYGKRLVTEKKVKERFNRIIRVIEYHLSSLFLTGGDVTRTGESLPSWIASSMPLDDSLDWIPESNGWKVRRVPKGEEGAIITIERIS